MDHPTHGYSGAPTASERLAAATALDTQIRALHERRNKDQAQLALRLAELARTRGYLALGFASLADYAYERLSWGRPKVRDLTKLVERLPHLPATRAEFMAGRLEWTKAVVVARATEQAPNEEARWLAEAQRSSVRELERKLAEERGEQPRHRVVLEVDDEGFALLQEGWRALRSEGHQLERGAATVELFRRALLGGSAGKPAFRILLCHDVESGETRLATGVGEVALAPEQADRLLCDAELQGPSGSPKRTIPRRVRDAVRARSQDRCEVPGCQHRTGLELHHLRGWRQGHEPDEILHVCPAHHRAPHEGLLRIEGSWRTGLTFRLADGTVLGTAAGAPAAAPAARNGATHGTPEVEEPAGTWRRVTEAPAHTRRAPPEPRASAERDVFLALTKLELPRREARARIAFVLAREPHLGNDAEELLRAALTCSAA